MNNQEPFCNTVAQLHDAISTMTTPTTMITGGASLDAPTRYYLSFFTASQGARAVETTADLFHLLFDDNGYYRVDRQTKTMYRKDAALLVLRPLLRNNKLTNLGI